jgi:hypothetical protein
MLLHNANDVIDAIVASLLKTTGPLVVMAGHFSLVHHATGSRLVPGIAEDIDDQKTRDFVTRHYYMGSFPTATWEAGIQVVLRLREAGRDAKLLLLVNDWQHVNAAVPGLRNADRDGFFARAELPPALKQRLNQVGLGSESLLFEERDGKPCVFWSESRLRSRYDRHLRHRVPVESSCAQEWVPLLAKLEELGVRGFAAFVPGSCRVPVTGGTERAVDVLDLELHPINIFPGGGLENFWENTWVEV